MSNGMFRVMDESVAFLSRPEQVAAVLSPIRLRILENLGRADSASGLARRMGLPRQKLNYHLRELEREGLVELAEERQRRGCVERCLRATARTYLVSPSLLGKLSTAAERVRDRFSSAYLIATAGRLVREVGLLRERAGSVEKPLTTLTLEADVAFSSPAELTAFSDELSAEIARLVKKHHKPKARGSRRYRFVLGAHPTVTKTTAQARREALDHARKKKTGRGKS